MEIEVFVPFCIKESENFFSDLLSKNSILFNKMMRYSQKEKRRFSAFSKSELSFFCLEYEMNLLKKLYLDKGYPLRDYPIDLEAVLDTSKFTHVSIDYFQLLTEKESEELLKILMQQLRIYDTDIHLENFKCVVNSALFPKLGHYLKDNSLSFDQITAEEILKIPNILPDFNRVLCNN